MNICMLMFTGIMASCTRVLGLQVDLPVYFKNQVVSTTPRGISRKSIQNNSFKLHTNDKSKAIKEGSLSIHAHLE